MTRPCIASARVRSAINSIVNAPSSPGSWRWMSTPVWCPLGDPEHRVELGGRISVEAQGRCRRPDRRRRAARHRGAERCPDRAPPRLREGDDLDLGSGRRERHELPGHPRAARGRRRCRSGHAGAPGWCRWRSSPRACGSRAATLSPAWRQFVRSFSIRPARPGPAVWERNGRPSNVESRWAWASTNAGNRRPPAPSMVSNWPAGVAASVAAGSDTGYPSATDQHVDQPVRVRVPRPHVGHHQIAHPART